MQRSIRLCLLTLFAMLAASCSDAGDALAPAQGSSRITTGHMASASAKQNDATTPTDADAVARYLEPSSDNGSQRVMAAIGPEGGSLRLGDFEIIVPPGAVDEKTNFSIQTFPENNPRKRAMAAFGPHATFNQPITLFVPLDGTESEDDPDATVVWQDGQDWVPLTSYKTDDGRLMTQTTHFSMYGTSRRGFTLAGG